MARYYIRTRSIEKPHATRNRLGGNAGFDWTHWVEVSREEFMRAERRSGFHTQHPGHPATHSFSTNSVEGKTVLGEEK